MTDMFYPPRDGKTQQAPPSPRQEAARAIRKAGDVSHGGLDALHTMAREARCIVACIPFPVEIKALFPIECDPFR